MLIKNAPSIPYMMKLLGINGPTSYLLSSCITQLHVSPVATNHRRLLIGRVNKERRAGEYALPYLEMMTLSDWWVLTEEGVNK